jgi:hypothetical protein
MIARRQRCTAHISDGSRPCERWAINGGTVCATHGGRAPQVKKSAKERLEELIDPALAGLHKALQSNDLGSIVKASQIVLDRTGFHPSQAIELTGKNGGPINVEPTINIEELPIWLKQALVIIGSGGKISPDLERVLSEEMEKKYLEVEYSLLSSEASPTL